MKKATKLMVGLTVVKAVIDITCTIAESKLEKMMEANNK